jgi:predicted AAA+ superfamily ATPase
MMYVKREIENEIVRLFQKFPVVTLTGPRQSGKTTLLKHVFPGLKYLSLEDPATREFAQTDPVGFLSKSEDGMILDEIHRVPELVSYIQGMVDDKNQPGMFIISGSQQFELTRSVSQSLAGRTAILRLFPFTLNEAYKNKDSVKTDKFIYTGFYPSIFAHRINPTDFYSSYLETYIRRDVNELISIKDIRLFQKFIQLCAGRIGQIIVASNLADEVGVTVKTIQAWLSILEASYLVYILHPFHANINKRLIKSSKMYFYDVGFASYLLGISDSEHVSASPYRGQLFENLVLMELKKYLSNRGKVDNLFFFRDSHLNEVDIISDKVSSFAALEIKSSQTFNKNLFRGLDYIRNLFSDKTESTVLCYDGDLHQSFNHHRIVNVRDLLQEFE